MIITSGNVQMGSSRKFLQSNNVLAGSTAMSAAGMYGKGGTGGVSGGFKNTGFLGNLVYRLDAAQKAQKTGKPQMITEPPDEQVKAQTINYLLQMLFGRQNQSGLFGSFLGQGGFQMVNHAYYSSYQESEETSFSTTGKVVTADGREIDFNVDVTMSRSFCEEYYETYQTLEPALCDPLVINLDGNVANVSDQKFYFDLDADGKEDEISRLGAGSGFLALDKNGDGKINDGSELFGTSSGNGFYDLAQYDLDGNGWIDEADEIFDKLKIWTMDADGTSKLYTLKESGVGAICLTNVNTDFSLNNPDNVTNGVIRRTGVFLREDGSASTIQHVDLAM